MKKLILKYPNGIFQDENLISCYSEVRQHLSDLKNEGWIREFTTEKLKEMWQDSNKLKASGDEDEEMKQVY